MLLAEHLDGDSRQDPQQDHGDSGAEGALREEEKREEVQKIAVGRRRGMGKSHGRGAAGPVQDLEHGGGAQRRDTLVEEHPSCRGCASAGRGSNGCSGDGCSGTSSTDGCSGSRVRIRVGRFQRGGVQTEGGRAAGVHKRLHHAHGSPRVH